MRDAAGADAEYGVSSGKRKSFTETMQIFYAPDIAGKSYILDERESKHLIRVLRATRGEAVRLIDGKGNLFEGRVADPDPRRCRIEISGSSTETEKRSYTLHIAISPLRNPERLDWFVEKSVEIGIDRITPVICRNSEKKTVKAERLEGIIISAMKQSVKPLKTILEEPVDFSRFVKDRTEEKKMIAFCSDFPEKTALKNACTPGGSVLIMIGPEGDFSPDEVSLAIAEGFIPVSLGQSRLRTETAGLAACHSVFFINQ
ncbi:MAG: 16S rRNA (uracil(1498)-N(3))-methyltransferase [Bacteroidales bacterium]|nr:16S rRNA (uracil(1498)-N(3))-methyltransferase [Bacteroidales bacterium]